MYARTILVAIVSTLLSPYALASDDSRALVNSNSYPENQPATARIAVLPPMPAPGIPWKSLENAAQVTLKELASLGFETVSPEQVSAAYKKSRHKLDHCGDAPECLASIGKKMESAFIVNISMKKTKRAYGIKVTIVDVENATIVSNIMGLVINPKGPALMAALKQKLPRTTSALVQYINEKQAKVALNENSFSDQTNNPEQPPAVSLGHDDQVAVDSQQPAHPTLQPSSLPEENSPDDIPQQRDQAPSDHTFSDIFSKKHILPVTLVSGGALICVGLGVFGSQAREAVSDFQSGNDPQNARNRAKSKALLADITTGAGIALVGAGIGFYLFLDQEPSVPEPPRPIFSVTPSGLDIGITGSF